MPRPINCKRDAGQELEVQRWIEAVLGSPFPEDKPFEDVLKDGIVLCRLINKIEPGSVAKVNESGPTFKMVENVNKFQEAIIKYGVDKKEVFQTNDLSEKRDMANVVHTLHALARVMKKRGDWSGPVLDA